MCAVPTIGVVQSSTQADVRLEVLQSIEAGRAVARDIGGSDPERMSRSAAGATVSENTHSQQETCTLRGMRIILR